jgi:hypothetical protein
VDRRGGEDGLKKQICSKDEEEKEKRKDLQLESFRSNPSKSIKQNFNLRNPSEIRRAPS